MLRRASPVRRHGGILRTALPALLLGGSASAQTIVRVESHGLPVAGAEVAAWDDAGRMAAAHTDILGLARLVSIRPTSGAAMLLVRRLGFAPFQIPLTQRDTLTITLEPVSVALPVLATNVTSLRCTAGSGWPLRRKTDTAPSDSDADSVWRASAARYAQGVSSLNHLAVVTSKAETITRDQRGYGDGSELPVPDPGSFNRFGDYAPPPYAEYIRHINVSGEYWAWRYSSISNYAAEHFVSESFHEQHRLVMLGTSAGSTVIGFCPRDLASPEIEGELKIGPDASLESARWFFKVPHDDEDVGGESTFKSIAFEGQRYLIGVRGSRWVRATSRTYTQYRFEVYDWKLSHRVQGIGR